MCPGGALRMSNGESLKARADHLCLVYLASGLSPTPAQSGEGKAMSNIIPFPRKSPMQAASLADSDEMPDVIEARRAATCSRRNRRLITKARAQNLVITLGA